MRFLLLGAALILCSCGGEADRARAEERAKAKGVAAAQNRVHEIKMKELGGGELSPGEKAERDRLQAESDEEQNGGNTPERSASAEEAP